LNEESPVNDGYFYPQGNRTPTLACAANIINAQLTNDEAKILYSIQEPIARRDRD
jgi:hypothetical protein